MFNIYINWVFNLEHLQSREEWDKSTDKSQYHEL